MPPNSGEPIEAIIIIDEVLETAEIEGFGSLVLVARSGSELLGLAFSVERARETAALLQQAADAIERE